MFWFYDKTADILDGDKQKVGTTKVDLQPFRKDKYYKDKDFALDITHRVFTDLNSNIDIYAYFRIDNIDYKIIEFKQYSDYLECWLYECDPDTEPLTEPMLIGDLDPFSLSSLDRLTMYELEAK